MTKTKGFQTGWWLIVVVIGLMVGYSFILQSMSIEETYSIMAINEIIIIVPVILGLFIMRGYMQDGESYKQALGLYSFPIKIIPFMIIIPICAQCFATYSVFPVTLLLQILFGIGSNSSEFPVPTTFYDILQSFMLLCVLAPILEEVLCRGILIKLFSRYGFLVAITFSSLAFALLHFDARGFIPIFCIGLLLGVIRYFTNSLFATIVMHSANNLAGLFMIIFPNIVPLFTVIATVLFPFTLYFFLKSCDKSCDFKKNIVLRTGVRTGVSIGMIITITTFFVYHIVLLTQRIINGDIINQFNGILR